MAGLYCCTGACGVVALGTTNVQRHVVAVGGVAAIQETTIVPPGCPASYKFIGSSYVQAAVSDSTLSGGFWLRFAAFPVAASAVVVQLANANGNGAIKTTASGVMQLSYGASANSVGPTISLDTWYWVTWKSDTSGGTATITASVYDENGDLVGSEWSQTNTQATAVVTGVRHGCSASPTSITEYVGGIYIDDSLAAYPHPLKKVVAMFPSGDGAHAVGLGVFLTDAAGAITDGTTDAWQSLPSTTIVGSAEHVRQTVSAATAYLEFAFSGAPSGTADVVTATCNLLSQGTGAHTQKFAINDNGTIADAVTATDFSQTTDSYCTKSWATAPASGAWTEAVLNAIRFRWGYGASFPDNAVLGGMILEVATDAAAPPALSGSATLTGGGVVATSGIKAGQANQALTGAGVVNTAARKAGAATAILTGGGVVTVASVTGRASTAAPTGAGVVVVSPLADRSATVIATGGGVVTVTASATSSEAHDGAAALTGGGVVTVASVAARASAAVFTGAGVVVTDARKGGASAEILTGGGVVVPVQATARALGASATGGGTVVVSSLDDRQAVARQTGGGVVAPAIVTARFGSAVLAGAGVVTATGTTAEFHAGTATLTGSGIVAAEATTARASSSAFTGAGAFTYAHTGDHAASVAATGSGSVTPSIAAARAGAALLSGGGVLTVLPVSARFAEIDLTGAGVVTATGARGLVLVLTGGGVVTVAGFGGRTASATATGGGVVVYTSSKSVASVVGTVGASVVGAVGSAGAGVTGQSSVGAAHAAQGSVGATLE